MRTMSALEYHVVIEELQKLKGSHLENIYSIGEHIIRLKFGVIDIIIEPGVRLHITKFIEKNDELSSFATTLRQHLRNFRLIAIYLHNDDRVIVFDFGTKKLICEMFGKGNIIVVENDITLAPLKQEEWSDRIIARNKPYSFPASHIKKTVAEALLAAPQKYVVVALLSLPLGKEYVLELLKTCGIDEKKKADSLSKQEIELLESAYVQLLKNIHPYGIYENEKISGVSLVKTITTAKEFQSVSEALDEYYFNNKEVKNEKLEKLKKRLVEQYKRLESLKQEEHEYKEKGDYFYEHYETIEKVLVTLKNTPLNELQEKFPQAKIDKKKKEIELEL